MTDVLKYRKPMQDITHVIRDVSIFKDKVNEMGEVGAISARGDHTRPSSSVQRSQSSFKSGGRGSG